MIYDTIPNPDYTSFMLGYLMSRDALDRGIHAGMRFIPEGEVTALVAACREMDAEIVRLNAMCEHMWIDTSEDATEGWTDDVWEWGICSTKAWDSDGTQATVHAYKNGGVVLNMDIKGECWFDDAAMESIEMAKRRASFEEKAKR